MNKKVKENIQAAIWIFTVVIFFLGVFGGYAHIAWLIFLVGAGAQALFSAYYHSKNDRNKKQDSGKEPVIDIENDSDD